MILAHAEVAKNTNIAMEKESRMLNLVEHKNNIEEIMRALEEVRGSL